jgi:mono/diheme cytochrome c family protein
MKKSTHWMGVFAMGIGSVALSGCSGDPTPMPGTAGTSTTGGAGGTGGGAAGGPAGGATGTQLQSPLYHVQLKGADAAAGQPAPPAYSAAGCNACHGANAEGTVVGPEIRFTPKDYAIYAVRNGRKTPSNMPSAMALFDATKVPDADLDAINTWQNSFTKPPTGQGLYLAMCGNCHGPTTATGGSAPVSIKGKSQVDVAMYVRNGGSSKDPSMRAKYMPMYDMTLLSEPELTSIVMYLNTP